MDSPVLLLPLTALQQRMWHLCTAYEGDASPIVVLAHRVRGRLDAGAFTTAVARVVDRHPSLRTTFAVRDGRPWQRIGPTGQFAVEHVRTGDPAPHVRELSEALLDLENGPLVRSRLITLDDDDHVWCFAAHHLLADGASAAIIGAEVAALYRGDPVPEAPDIIPQDETDDLAWWVERLRGVPPLELSTHTRPPVKTASSACVDHVIGAEPTRRLERLARDHRVTLFMVLLSAYQIMLEKLTGQSDFCVGTPVDGRVELEQEQAVGLFANMLALRCDLSGDPSPTELLRRTRVAAIEALARQSVPFGQIVGALGLPPDRSRTQVFQTIFALHTETPAQGFALPGCAVEPFGAGSPQVLHDLVLDIWRAPSGGLDLAFRYDTALFTADRIGELAQLYEATLGEL